MKHLFNKQEVVKPEDKKNDSKELSLDEVDKVVGGSKTNRIKK